MCFVSVGRRNGFALHVCVLGGGVRQGCIGLQTTGNTVLKEN